MPRRTARKSTNTLPSVRNGSTGRPSKLTDVTEDAIIHAVLAGNHLTTACAAAGISNRTLYRWLDQADVVETAIEEGTPYDVSGLRYVEFRQRLADARAQAEMKAVQVVQDQMRGGYVISEEPLQDSEGNAVYDNEGNLLVKRQYAQPDGRLALAYLARSRPDAWGQKATAVEVNLGGAPVAAGEASAGADQIGALAERLAGVIQRRQDDDAEDGVVDADVVEGEVVEEDEHGRIE